jgi:hypothetical protein
MAQTDIALGGAYGTGGGRWARTAVAATIALALAGGVAWFGWRSTVPTSRVAGLAVVPITGAVVTEGGTQIQGAGSRPIRSAPMLVAGVTTSGRRIVRRFTADRQGHFQLKLPPGRYTFTAVIYQGAIPLAQEPHATAHIRPGQQPHIRIVESVV